MLTTFPYPDHHSFLSHPEHQRPTTLSAACVSPPCSHLGLGARARLPLLGRRSLARARGESTRPCLGDALTYADTRRGRQAWAHHGTSSHSEREQKCQNGIGRRRLSHHTLCRGRWRRPRRCQCLGLRRRQAWKISIRLGESVWLRVYVRVHVRNWGAPMLRATCD